MDKRRFLTTAATAMGVAARPTHSVAAQTPKGAKAPALLTVTGAIGKGDRGALDPALDQMMAKQKIAFDKAHAFDFAALTALPATTIQPTLEYDSKPHTLKGPLWAVYDADRAPDMAAKPVTERFAQCPWGMYHMAVLAG